MALSPGKRKTLERIFDERVVESSGLIVGDQETEFRLDSSTKTSGQSFGNHQEDVTESSGETEFRLDSSTKTSGQSFGNHQEERDKEDGESKVRVVDKKTDEGDGKLTIMNRYISCFWKPKSWEVLPSDILAEIVKRVCDDCDVLSVRRVCKHWKCVDRRFKSWRIATLVDGKMNIFNLKSKCRQIIEDKHHFRGSRLVCSIGSMILISKTSSPSPTIYNVLDGSSIKLPKLDTKVKVLFGVFSGKFGDGLRQILFLLTWSKGKIVLFQHQEGEATWKKLIDLSKCCDSRFLKSMTFVDGKLIIREDRREFAIDANSLWITSKRYEIARLPPPPDLIEFLDLPKDSTTIIHGAYMEKEERFFAEVKRGNGKTVVDGIWMFYKERSLGFDDKSMI